MLGVPRSATRRAVVWMCLIVGLVVIGAGCQTALPSAYVVEAETDPYFMLLTDGAGVALEPPEDPFDPVVPDSGGNYQDSGYSTTSGIMNILGRLQGDENPAPVAFRGPSDRALWFDLDQSVTGTVYVSNSLSATSPKAIESGIVRIQLIVDGAMAGGMDFPLGPGAAQNAATWVPIHFSFRAEAAAIPKGAEIGLDVSLLSGLSDFRIGTGGDHQSFARIQTYPFNPISGATYLENHALVIQTPDDDDAYSFLRHAERASAEGAFDELPPGVYYLIQPEAEPDDAAIALGGGLLLLPLVFSLGNKQSRRAMLATLVIASVAMAGCAKGTEPTASTDDADPILETTVDEKKEKIESEAEEEVELGAIKGVVKDWQNLSLPGAHVAIAGTSLFMNTDDQGRFDFPEVAPGTYGLRVDADDMLSLEKTIEVVAGERTVLTVRMAPLDPRAPDRVAHVHNEWGSATSLVVDELTFTPDLNKGYLISQPSGGEPVCVPWTTTGIDGRAQYTLCNWDIPTDFKQKVPPGAGQVEIAVSWTGTATEMGVVAYNANIGRDEVDEQYMPRGKGVPTRVTFFPNEADPGHQQFTNWAYQVYIPSSDPTTLGQQPVIDVGAVTVTITAHRAVVPFEPGHPDFWADGERIKVFSGEQISFGTINVGLPYSSARFTPESGLFVPVGTGRISGTFTVSTNNAGEPGVLQNFGLAYKPSNIPTAQWEDNLVDIDLAGNYPTFTFDIDVPQTHLDQPYQTSSNFHLYPTSDSPQAYRGAIKFTLDMTAHQEI